MARPEDTRSGRGPVALATGEPTGLVSGGRGDRGARPSDTAGAPGAGTNAVSPVPPPSGGILLSGRVCVNLGPFKEKS